MWLFRQLYTVIRCVAAISVPMLLAACSNPSQSEVDAQTNLSQTALAQESEGAVDETSRAAIDTDATVPAPYQLNITNVRADYVSLEWVASQGDTIQSLPGDDTVSYYRVLRNGQLLVNAFTTNIEDNNPPQGHVIYAVQAVKFALSPEFLITHSTVLELSVYVPSAEKEQVKLNAQLVNESFVSASLTRLKSCALAHTKPDGSALCSNHLGHAWPVSQSGEVGELLPHRSSVGSGLYVVVENRDAQFGPIPDVPEWIVNDIVTGESTGRDLSLDAHVYPGERVLVNGVVVVDSNEVVISGTLYQSYLPRSLGPSPGVLPVTSAYFIVRMNAISGKVVKFQRFMLSRATGTVASLNNGVLEMYHTGQVTWVDVNTLAAIGVLRVVGVPIFSDEVAVYSQTDNGVVYRVER